MTNDLKTDKEEIDLANSKGLVRKKWDGGFRKKDNDPVTILFMHLKNKRVSVCHSGEAMARGQLPSRDDIYAGS